jgi:hypothetical protein
LNSRVTPSFWRALRTLTRSEQRAAKRAYRRFIADPSHPSLQFKKLSGQDNLWSTRVSISIRAVGQRDGETVVWVWIGSHSSFDNKFG